MTGVKVMAFAKQFTLAKSIENAVGDVEQPRTQREEQAPG